MDRGFLLGITMVFIGWFVILLSMILTKFLLLVLSTRGFLLALLDVAISLLIFALSLLLWYIATRRIYRRILSEKKFRL
jgi:membrane protein implicated in regulation of membrane protease activity